MTFVGLCQLERFRDVVRSCHRLDLPSETPGRGRQNQHHPLEAPRKPAPVRTLATGLLTQACHPLLPHLPRAWDICKNGPGLVYVLHHNRKTLAETPTITGPEDGMPSTALDTHACACASHLLLYG